MSEPKIGYMVIDDYDEDYSNWDGQITFPDPTGANLHWLNPIKMIEYTAYEALQEQLRVAKDTLEKLPHVGNCMNVDKDFQSGIRQLCFKCNRLKQLG